MNNYTKISDFLKEQVNSHEGDYYAKVIADIKNQEDKKTRIKLLKQLKLLAQNNIQSQKDLNIQINTIKPFFKKGHQRGASNSTFFDNFKSVSQVNSCVQSRQLEVFNEIKANYNKQIQQKEIELIKIKNEKYKIVDTLEDFQYELMVQKRILQLHQQRLQEQEKEINNYFNFIEKIQAHNSKQKKPPIKRSSVTTKSNNNSQELKFSFSGIKDFFSKPKHQESLVHPITSRSTCFNQSSGKIDDQRQDGTFKF